MNDAQTLLGNPSVGFFMLLLIGIIAGWIAEKVTSSDHGLFTNLLVGVCGAFVGTKLAEVLQINLVGRFWQPLIAATVGAIIILFVWRMIQSRSSA